MFYAASTNSYYLPESPWLPKDCVSITEETYQALLEGGRSGQVLTPDEKGYPVLVARTWSQEELQEIAGSQRVALLAMADDATKTLRTDLMLGIITDDDKATLTTWQTYIKALKAVDTARTPDITWPEIPA